MSSLWLMVGDLHAQVVVLQVLEAHRVEQSLLVPMPGEDHEVVPVILQEEHAGRGSCSTAFCMRLAWSRSGSSRPAADAAAARLALHPIGSCRPVVGSVMRYWPGVATVSHRSGWRWFHCSMPASIASIGLCPSAGLMAKDSVARVTSRRLCSGARWCRRDRRSCPPSPRRRPCSAGRPYRVAGRGPHGHRPWGRVVGSVDGVLEDRGVFRRLFLLVHYGFLSAALAGRAVPVLGGWHVVLLFGEVLVEPGLEPFEQCLLRPDRLRFPLLAGRPGIVCPGLRLLSRGRCPGFVRAGSGSLSGSGAGFSRFGSVVCLRVCSWVCAPCP